MCFSERQDSVSLVVKLLAPKVTNDWWVNLSTDHSHQHQPPMGHPTQPHFEDIHGKLTYYTL